MLKDFREFAVKGNVIDLAVGVIIGSAFGKIVSSLVADVVMPPIGILLDGVDFSDLTLTLKQATEEAAAVELRYGLFINNVIDFLIIAFVVFLMVKQINRLKKQEEKKEQKQEKKADPAEDILLLREIRDSLKSKK